jgi:hypothetical protein
VTYNNLYGLDKEVPFRIKLDIYFDDKLIFDEFGNTCTYESPIVDDHVPKLDINAKKKKKRLEKLNLDVPIEELQYCIKHFPGYLQNVFKGEKTLYLRFTLQEILNEGVFKAKAFSYIRDHEKRDVGFFIFKASDLQMQIREGRFKNILLKAPLIPKPPLPADKIYSPLQTSLDFTIEIFEYTTREKSLYAFRRKPKVVVVVKKKEVEVDKKPFIPNLNPGWSDVQFEKGSGIDFYVDSARYLPTSVTISKVLVRFVDSDLNDLMDPISKVSELSSKVFEPEFNMRVEMRFPYFNPTTMMIISLFTVDVRDDEGKPSIVGYAFFPLFLDRETKEQPTSQENFVRCSR